MKFFLYALLPAVALSFVVIVHHHPSTSTTQLMMAEAAPAKSKEEDLDLTRKVIVDFTGIESPPATSPQETKGKKDKEDESEDEE